MIKKFKRHKDDLICDSETKYHDMRIYAVKCHHADPNVLVTGGWDDTIKVMYACNLCNFKQHAKFYKKHCIVLTSYGANVLLAQ